MLTPPGAGALGRGADDRFERWVLVVNTDSDDGARSITTAWTVADVGDDTLAQADTAVLDGLALTKALAAAHVGRVTEQRKWILTRDAVKTLSKEQRAIIERHARG
jgi:hypothetical protein